MRTREVTLLLLLCVLAFATHEQVQATLLDVAGGEASFFNAIDTPVKWAASWRYAEEAAFYGIVPARVRKLRSRRPADVARAVCASLGGRLDIIQPVTPDRDTVGFNCAFHEPDLSMSTDFGDLRRIPARFE